MKEIIEFLKRKPDLEKIIAHHIRNEGYFKSLNDESCNIN